NAIGNVSNFVQNTGTGSPADSFIVYLGVPVDLDNVTTADGTLHQPDTKHPHGVYDVYRRWLSEVIRLDRPIEEVLSVGGSNNTTFSVSGRALAAYYNAQSGSNRYLRVAFRVHTNRGFDDLTGITGFNSGGQGAVLLDEVAIGGSGVSG